MACESALMGRVTACLSSLVAGMVATSVMTLGPSSAQVSVTWARYPVQRVTWPRRE
jgi:hypothetical protein